MPSPTLGTSTTKSSVITRVVKANAGVNGQSTMIAHEERSLQGPWSKPGVPILIFADHKLPTPSVAFWGGPIGSGLPVQLIFWGSWWNSANGVGQQWLIIERTKALIASDYFSELEQYGIARPTWRGALVVTEPAAPNAFNSEEDAKAVPDLIDDLIDDDVFPDPDDGRIAFIVLMPQGFTQNIGANGAHTYDYDYDFPFDEDNFWVGWVRFFDPGAGEDPEDTMRTLSHELIELFTDPEPRSGWYASPLPLLDTGEGEISDAGVSGNTKQVAWVNGVKVQSYWSNRHSATIIPVDRDYAARLQVVTSEESRKILRSGTFRPEPSDSAACERLQECCVEDRDYSWVLHGFDEVARVRLTTVRYREPKSVWAIEGITVAGVGNLSFNVLAEIFSGRKPEARNQMITVSYTATDSLLEIHVAGSECNFDLNVSCRVTDASIQGNVKTENIAEPTIVVGFVGAQIELDSAYIQQRIACFSSMVAQYNLKYKRLSNVPTGRGDPIDESMIAELPAYARIERYRQSREALMLSKMAKILLPTEKAQIFAQSLFDTIPAVTLSQKAQQVEHSFTPVTDTRLT